MIVENPILSHNLVLGSHGVLYEVIDVTLTIIVMIPVIFMQLNCKKI